MIFRSWDCELGKIQDFWEPILKNEQKLKFPPKNGHEWPPPTPMVLLLPGAAALRKTAKSRNAFRSFKKMDPKKSTSKRLEIAFDLIFAEIAAVILFG